MIDSSFTIIVEGIADEKFISDYLKFLKIDFEDNIFFIIEGDVKSKENRIEKELKKKDINKTFFIIDFDKDKTKYENTIKTILKKSKYPNIKSFLKNNIFFLPDNEKTGNLEDLINKTIKSEEFNTCFKSYEKCLERIKGVDKKNLPPLKAKIFSYDSVFGGAGKDEKRNYLDKNKYNLSHDDLKPLKDFLTNNIIKKIPTP